MRKPEVCLAQYSSSVDISFYGGLRGGNDVEMCRCAPVVPVETEYAASRRCSLSSTVGGPARQAL